MFYTKCSEIIPFPEACADDTKDPAATLNDVREAVTTLEETERTMRRVLGGAHPHTERIEVYLQESRTLLRAREATHPSGGAS